MNQVREEYEDNKLLQIFERVFLDLTVTSAAWRHLASNLWDCQGMKLVQFRQVNHGILVVAT